MLLSLPLLLAQMFRPGMSWGVVEIAIAIVMVAAVVALVYIALRKFGVAIPDWAVQVVWVIVVAAVVIFAIKFVVSLG